MCARITRELLLHFIFMRAHHARAFAPTPLQTISLAFACEHVESCAALVSAPDACRCFHIGRDPDSAEEECLVKASHSRDGYDLIVGVLILSQHSTPWVIYIYIYIYIYICLFGYGSSSGCLSALFSHRLSPCFVLSFMS